MHIAVVGATGRIGARLTRTLLRQGHAVSAISRGGEALDALVRLGARPVIASFDSGSGACATAFQDADAAFLMVKTNWNDIHGHYPAVAARFVDALRHSPVRHAVSLSAMGADVPGPTGHFACFRAMEQALEVLDHVRLVHLRAAWFMENSLAWTGAVARHGRIGWAFDPQLRMPWVATADVADLAAAELSGPVGEHRAYREVGSEDLSMSEIAAIIGRAIDQSVTYRFVDSTRKDIEAVFLERFGSAERWQDDALTAAALNEGRVRFHGVRAPMPTSMATFVREVWVPRFRASLGVGDEPETFSTWSASA